MNESPFRDQSWQRWRVKDGEKGPILWEEKHALFTLKNEDGMPGEPMHLVVARNVLDVNEVKFFASNAPPETPVQKMLLVGFSRWRVERCFEDHKSEIVLDQYEGRRYQGLKRHLILSCVSYLFLSRMREEFGGKNRDLTVCQVHTAIAALIPSDKPINPGFHATWLDCCWDWVCVAMRPVKRKSGDVNDMRHVSLRSFGIKICDSEISRQYCFCRLKT